MGNEKNLKPIRSAEEAREKGRKGGKASGKARREKRQTHDILREIVNLDIKDNALLTSLAAQCGLTSDKSVHDLATMMYFLNSLKKGNLNDLEQLSRLLGEKVEQKKNNGILDDLSKYLKNEQP